MKKFLSLLLTLALCAGLGVPALAAGFSDVPSGHYAAAAIDACVERGITSGFADGTFRPAAPVTRAQFCVMVARAFAEDNLKYSDTEENRAAGWFVPYTSCLYYQGPYGGALEGTSFQEEHRNAAVMNQPINRYDMAQILYFFTFFTEMQISDDARLAAAQARIADWDAVPSRYSMAVRNCYAAGILTGLSDGTFGGEKTMNRAQACAVIYRMLVPNSRGTASQPAPAQPSQPSQPNQPSSGLPEIRCYGCGYLMRPAGGTVVDLNNGGSSSGFCYMCDLCSQFYICQQCSQHSADAELLLHRHKAVCASGGTVAPMEDFYSPYYRGSVYHQRLKSVSLTGNYRQDILAVAASQIGYKEGSSATQLDGSHGGGGDYSEYSWIFGEDAAGAWCSEFASWCARQANVPTDILHSSLSACADNFGGTAYAWSDTVFAGGYYSPQPGDLMLISRSGGAISTSDSLDHTTIVESVDWTGDTVRITVIDGNSSNSVRRHDYTYNVNRGLKGYFVSPNY